MKRLSALLLLIAAGCAGRVAGTVPAAADARAQSITRTIPYGVIQHVVIIVQENRSVDNLFNGLPGADTVTSGKDSHGNTIPLQPISISAPYDIDHRHGAFTTEYDNGGMDGFDKVMIDGKSAPKDAAYGYVPQSQVQPYFDMAEQYAFADRMFQSNSGDSLAAHQYVIAGTAATSAQSRYYAMNNPKGSTYAVGGCDSPSGTLESLIDVDTNDQSQSAFPCFDHPTLMDLLSNAGDTWRYYESRRGPGLWNAPDAISHIRYGPLYGSVIAPNSLFLKDLANGRLASVTWVIPNALQSDHPRQTDGSGPSYVAQMVDAVGQSKFWPNCAIFVVWDDWGGWYDHVAPQQFNYYELGFRVPLIAISPYARTSYVSHTQHEFGSILKFVEESFNLGSLGYTDVRADDLSDMFNFGQRARTFKKIPYPASVQTLQRDSLDTSGPDNDF